MYHNHISHVVKCYSLQQLVRITVTCVISMAICYVVLVLLLATGVGAHCGRADQGPEMDPRSRSRLVERTAVGEGGRG